jgi:hypothetical protein
VAGVAESEVVMIRALRALFAGEPTERSGEYTTTFERGQIVRYRADSGSYLRSGASAYGAAVVVNTRPLVLVSADCDMRWQSTVKPENLEIVGKVSWWRLRLHFDSRRRS